MTARGWSLVQILVVAASTGLATHPDMTLLSRDSSKETGQGRGQGDRAAGPAPFYMDIREITVADYLEYCRGTGNRMPPPPLWGWELTNLPIVNVTWHEAVAYAAWRGKRLPTAAEYEFAMRDGDKGWRYPWGNNITAGQANHADIIGRPCPAGIYRPNRAGICDIAGNVWAWCSDPATEKDNDKMRIVKGGSWASPGSMLKCAAVSQMPEDSRYSDLGIRCAASFVSTNAHRGQGLDRVIPHAWQTKYFAAGCPSDEDNDRDGLSNWEEYLAATDPTVSNMPALQLTVVADAPEGGAEIRWPAVAGTSYNVTRAEASSTIFTEIATNVPATPPTNVHIDREGASSAFRYRIVPIIVSP